MVYAPYGRTGVYMLQEYARRLGIGTSNQEIDDLVASLESLPSSHPLAAVLRGSRDARNPDALADALLNPRDRSYSVPQLFDFIERNGLTMSRWYWQAPYLASCGAIASTPHARRLAALPPRDQYAAMELWRGTMASHSIVVRQHDASDGAPAARFDDERALASVPIRLPWTTLVQERLPPGAAGVLLNQSHAHPDLVLPINAREKDLFQRIDGHRTIAEIAGQASAMDSLGARAFFERLWFYDQVVFDMSNVP
jgi:hypothetical protein